MYFQRMKKAFLNFSLASKLKYIYTALIFLCISCNLLILYGFFSREMQKTISTLTSQTVETVSQNVDSSLSVISKTSTYLLGTAEVQNYLQDMNHSEYAILSKQLRNFLYLTMESMPLVSSIIVMQPSGTYEGAARYALPSIEMDSLSAETVTNLGHTRYLLLKFRTSGMDWNYIAAINYHLFTGQHRAFILISITILLVSFAYANVTPYHDEIGELQNAYNDMVDKIQQLLEAKVSEQKRLRKAELNVLQEQINPHFLYNSLGAISYLVTSGQNEKAYDLIISLSEYYRESLSKGNKIIPLSAEINIVKNYLNLLKVRFPDIFTDEYDLQEDVLPYQIPRLILQPLVEN